MSTDPTGHEPNAEVVPLHPDPPRPDPGPPKAIEADITSHPWSGPAVRRPILPPWLRHSDQRRSAARWAVVHASHVSAFHAVRLPLYAGRHA
jgi:S-DNA-T family DNA segregation ATPase FtsK/SpoIIIE